MRLHARLHHERTTANHRLQLQGANHFGRLQLQGVNHFGN